ncbi:ubiquinone anaerobic biosynthesis protein UbiU [Rhodospirillum centenum]|uniref:Ubiquinone biosynthesis protein UbiU n=1 Tax=Rhodospirillum centenum (strain ATCC 51521 / SW) TaxID=414684 RepID=B6ISC7_RHOCS|nr:peptidase U32 family protein [Rhodospirillum centenum]ACI98363.1 peptidase, U32 family, putative [Rhodospirillum centenum SW]
MTAPTLARPAPGPAGTLSAPRSQEALTPLELVCPAGTPAALRSAVDAGADVVYVGFRDETNARNFPGLNFTPADLAQGVAYAHQRGCQVYVAINTFPTAGNPGPWHKALAEAEKAGVDAVILADIGLLDHASRNHPNLRLHLSVQASASNADSIAFYQEQFGVKRVVLPRVLTIEEIAKLNSEISVETEVFAFGGLCVMAEGRCSLSSYATGRSPNMNGVCSPAECVHYKQENDTLFMRLGEFTINAFRDDEPAGYPTLCKGKFVVDGKPYHVFEDPASLNAVAMIPELMKAGVTALKIEGRQRGRAYVTSVVQAFRRAVDAVARGEPVPEDVLTAYTEGSRTTTGALQRKWK